MTRLATASTVGPVTLTRVPRLNPVSTVTEGRCTVADCPKPYLLGADLASAETLARRHWLLAHPDWTDG